VRGVRVGRGVYVGGMGLGVSVGNLGLGVGDGITVGKGVTVRDAKVLVGDIVGETGTLHPTSETSKTKNGKQVYWLLIEIFILHFPFVSYPRLPMRSHQAYWLSYTAL
jgi:hypothetical protein